MEYDEIMKNIKIGKKDKPQLFCNPNEAIIYDINDIDGQYFMLDHDMSGCIALPFTKPMQKQLGSVTLDGIPVWHIVKRMSIGTDAQWLGVRLRGHIREYGQKGILHISGFVDVDGNMMEPLELQIQGINESVPLQQYEDHEAIALQAAEEGIVLLKNENETLPLKHNEILNVFGRGLFEFRVCAVGAGKINPRYIRGFREAVNKDVGFCLNQELEQFYCEGYDKIPDEDVIKRALQMSDKAIMVISRASGENYDNSSEPGEFYLTDDENKLLKKLSESFTHTIVILNVGYPIETSFIDKYNIDAVIYSGYGGMLGGQALVNILHGTTNPSGKLPDTWSIRYEDIPAAANFYDCADGKKRIGVGDSEIWVDTVYEEDIYVGYRYFETFQKEVGFPFGFGLSYSTFSVVVASVQYDRETGLTIYFSVENTGKYAGKETIQIYIQKPHERLEQPVRELVEFEKTRTLQPGEIQQFIITVPKNHMVSYNEEYAAYIMESGIYRVYIGADVRSAKESGAFHLNKMEIIKQVYNRMQPVHAPLVLSMQKPQRFPEGKYSGIKEISELSPKRENCEYSVSLYHTNKKGITFQDVLMNETLVPSLVASMEIEDLARVAVCASTGWGMDGTGEAGSLYQVPEFELPSFIVADGNSGVNVKKPNIGMPSGVTICASFNKALSSEVGRIIGEEARELGIHLILAPGLNIHRNPLNGRHPEYFSEDPYLAGKMAGYYCKGLEGTGVGGCYKHLLANNAETARKQNQSIITERAIREIYFRPFEYALEEHEAVSLMTSYNAVNGCFTSEDADLIQGLLREECGYQGFLMTDWESYASADIISMLTAGISWITPGSLDDTYTGPIIAAVKEGRLDSNRLRENVLYLLKALVKLNRSNHEIQEKQL